MAKAGRKRKAGRRTEVQSNYVRPTEQREAHNEFQSAGMACRVVPVIDTLKLTGRLTQAEYDALNHYRDQAHRAEDDCAQCSTLAPERIMGGGGSTGGGRIPVSVMLHTPAIVETGRLERELGSLLGIARAIAVKDWTLTRWAIEQSGGREQTREGRATEIVPRDPQALGYAHIELRFAAAKIRG